MNKTILDTPTTRGSENRPQQELTLASLQDAWNLLNNVLASSPNTAPVISKEPGLVVGSINFNASPVVTPPPIFTELTKNEAYTADFKIAEVIINGSGQYSGEIDYMYNDSYLERAEPQALLKVKQRLVELLGFVEKELTLRGQVEK